MLAHSCLNMRKTVHREAVVSPTTPLGVTIGSRTKAVYRYVTNFGDRSLATKGPVNVRVLVLTVTACPVSREPAPSLLKPICTNLCLVAVSR